MTKIKIAHEIVENGYFTRQVNEYLKKKSSFVYPRSRVIRPSSIAECTRKIVCDILGLLPLEEITPKKQRIFDNGDAVHERYLKKYLPAIGCAARIVTTDKKGNTKLKDFIEVSLRDEDYWIKCRPDAVIINYEDGLPYILEIKSIKQESFDALQQPDEAYMQQVHLYMHVTKIPRAIVYYENKNTQEPKEFLIYQDNKLMEQLLQKIRTIQTYVIDYFDTKKLPAPCTTSYCSCKEVK
jgi:hypothetical protein